jgi:ADP-heptose:LPS heptosyltransferase
MSTIGTIDMHHAPLPDVRKIAVLNPSAVGDFIVTLPALHAIKAAYPHAQIVYIGKQWHAELLMDRPGPVDQVAVIPPVPGVGASPDMRADDERIEAFLRTMRSHRFDVAIQMYGGGRYSNPFIKRFGARITVGLKASDAEPLDRCLPFVYLQNNRLRMLEVAALVGANRLQLGQELAVIARDREEGERIVPRSAQPLVLLHPAASDVRRHWPPESFAAIGDALAEQGACVAVNGVESEAGIVRGVTQAMRHPAVDLSGGLSLSGLCGLLERASLLVSNDTGPLHLALAIGTPCVGIYWFSNLYVAGPLVQHKHRAALSLQVRCPVCGEENVVTRCAHDVSFVAGVPVEQVRDMAFELLKPDCRADCAPAPEPHRLSDPLGPRCNDANAD